MKTKTPSNHDHAHSSKKLTLDNTKCLLKCRFIYARAKMPNKLKFFFYFITLSLGISMTSISNAGTAEQNQQEGIDFLAKNSKEEGVLTTGTGLQYKVLTQGTGASPSATDQVTVHYRGTTLAGDEFDSSYARKQPATFPLNRVIAGWTEGLQLMKEGAKYQFFIPSNLAYGSRGAGRAIGPNATLIFEVELLKISN